MHLGRSLPLGIFSECWMMWIFALLSTASAAEVTLEPGASIQDAINDAVRSGPADPVEHVARYLLGESEQPAVFCRGWGAGVWGRGPDMAAAAGGS